MPRKYRLKEAPTTGGTSDVELKAGDFVYSLRGPDYGLANMDSRGYGEEYTSVTLNEDGDYPGFTVPVRLLEAV